jgi:hypothetical protein
MLVHLGTASATTGLRQTSIRRVFLVASLAAVTSACSAPPPAPLAGADPSNPSARVPALKYRSTLGTYSGQRPVESAPWAEPAPPAKP